jgi:hypothetical protein
LTNFQHSRNTRIRTLSLKSVSVSHFYRVHPQRLKGQPPRSHGGSSMTGWSTAAGLHSRWSKVPMLDHYSLRPCPSDLTVVAWQLTLSTTPKPIRSCTQIFCIVHSHVMPSCTV